MAATKFQLRKTYRDICARITPKYRQEAAQAAANIFTQQAIFTRSEHVACYLALDNEFDTTPLIEAIWEAKKNCYVPVVSEKDDKVLHFVRYQYGDALRLNRYKILEPAKKVPEMTLMDLQVVLVPLIAFDLQGHRLGTGGGYYDKTFAFVRGQPALSPKLIGLGYAEQEAAEVPEDPWDIRLNGVVTEKGFTKV